MEVRNYIVISKLKEKTKCFYIIYPRKKDEKQLGDCDKPEETVKKITEQILECVDR